MPVDRERLAVRYYFGELQYWELPPQKALHGPSHLFDEATHVRVHLCGLSEPPESLRCEVV